MSESIDSVRDVVTTISNELTVWTEEFVKLLPNLVVAIAVLMLFWGLAKLAAMLIERGMRRAFGHPEIRNLITKVTYLGVLSAGLAIALGVLDLQKTVASLLAGVGVVGLALGFAFQDIAANFMSGVILAIRKPFKSGDYIQSSGFEGVVETINLRSTVGHTFQGQKVVIPNKDLLNTNIVNYSSRTFRRVDLPCGVGYATDLDHAAEIARDAVANVEECTDHEPVSVIYTEFGNSSINFIVRFWVNNSNVNFLNVRSKAIIAIHKAFGAENINIPFPIRTLDVDWDGLSNSMQAVQTASNES